MSFNCLNLTNLLVVMYFCVKDDIVAAIEARLAAWTFLPEGIVTFKIIYNFINVHKVITSFSTRSQKL